jgi:hypothetical protein
MTALCKICGEIISGLEVFIRPDLDPPGIPPIGNRKLDRLVELQEFELLSAATMLHISMRHPAQAEELVVVANLSAKAYAMRWAHSTARNFEALRGPFSEAIRQLIFGPQAAEEIEPSSGGASSSSSLPS